VRVPVPVVGTRADEPDLGAGRREERRIRRRRAVVRDREHLRAEPVRGGRQQVTLGRGLDVTGEQDPAAALDVRSDDGGALVQLGTGVAVGPSRRGVQHLQHDVTDPRDGAAGWCADGDRAGGRLRPHLGRLGQLGRQRRRPDRRHLGAAEDLGDPADVVEVRVRHDDEVETGPPVPTQPPRGCLPLPCIDQDPGVGRLEQEGVALPDVDRGDARDAHRQASQQRLDTRQHHRQHGDGRSRPGPAGPPARQHPPTAGQEPGHRRRPGELDHATHAREAVGRREHDPGRPPRRCEDPRPRLERHQRDQRADEPQRGRHRTCRDRHEVRGDGRQTDLPEGRQQQRHDRELRAEGDRQQLAQPARETARQPLPDDRRDHEHAHGGRGGQQQPEGSGQPGIEEHEQQHRDGDGVSRLAHHPADRRTEQQQGHRPRTQHAGLEAGDEGEPGHHAPDRQPATPGRDTQDRGCSEHPADHDGHVAPGDRGQVRQPRGAHGLTVVLGEQPRVADDEAHEQSTHALVEVTRRARSHRRAHVLGRTGQRAGATDGLPRLRVDDRDRVLARQPPPVPAVGQRTRRCPRDPAGPQRRRVSVEREGHTLARRHPVHAVHVDHDVPAGGDGPGLPADREVELGQPPAVDQRREQTLLGGRDACTGRDGGDHDHGEQHQGSDTAGGASPTQTARVDHQADQQERHPHGADTDRPPHPWASEVIGRDLSEQSTADGRDRPRGHRTDDGMDAGGRVLADGVTVRPGDAHPATTRSARDWKVASPIPGTSRRSPGTPKGPCSSR
jgi:hypothetical protein